MLKRYFCSLKKETDSQIDILSSTAYPRCSRQSKGKTTVIFSADADKAHSGSILMPSPSSADESSIQREDFLKIRDKSFNKEQENFEETRVSLPTKSVSKLEHEFGMKNCIELEFQSQLSDDSHKSGDTSLILSKDNLLLPRGLDKMDSSYKKPYKSKPCKENLN